jgi:hypothetical protein
MKNDLTRDRAVRLDEERNISVSQKVLLSKVIIQSIKKNAGRNNLEVFSYNVLIEY